jgi:hypothetical protein
MKRFSAGVVLGMLTLAVAGSLWAHDPRTTAKDFQTGLTIEGAGKALIEYKAMHFNQATWDRMKANEQFRQRISSSVWNNIGKANLGFDIQFGPESLAKGTYDFGIDIDANETFSLVFTAAGATKKFKLQTITGENLSTDFLSISMTPTAEPDQFVMEARCGKFRGWQTFKVPYLAAHDHPGDKPTKP